MKGGRQAGKQIGRVGRVGKWIGRSVKSVDYKQIEEVEDVGRYVGRYRQSKQVGVQVEQGNRQVDMLGRPLFKQVLGKINKVSSIPIMDLSHTLPQHPSSISNPPCIPTNLKQNSLLKLTKFYWILSVFKTCVFKGFFHSIKSSFPGKKTQDILNHPFGCISSFTQPVTFYCRWSVVRFNSRKLQVCR